MKDPQRIFCFECRGQPIKYTTMGKAKLEIPILYGSQTGNAEAASIELASVLPKELSSPTLQIISRATHLDDFLEHGAKWTPLFVIITSSYGVGQAVSGNDIKIILSSV